LIAGGTFLAALCVTFALENAIGSSHGAERRGTAMSAAESAAPAIQVNRALKGDRLWVRHGGEPAGVQGPGKAARGLPDGCESAFGPILPETTPSRCVT